MLKNIFYHGMDRHIKLVRNCYIKILAMLCKIEMLIAFLKVRSEEAGGFLFLK